MSVTHEAKKEIEDFLRNGQKIQAIQYVRETFQVSLEDATILVEAVEKEMGALPADHTRIHDASNSSTTILSGDIKSEVERLIGANQKLQAVKYVRLQQRTSLKRSLQLVEEVEREINPGFTPLKLGSGCASSGLGILSLFFFIGSLMLLGGAGLTYYLEEEGIKNSELIKGKVISMKPYSSYDDGNQSMAPVVAYQWQGEEKTYESQMHSYPPAYHVGEEVELYVNRDNPDDVYINSFADRWLLVTILGGVGGFFLIFAIILNVLSRKLR